MLRRHENSSYRGILFCSYAIFGAANAGAGAVDHFHEKVAKIALNLSKIPLFSAEARISRRDVRRCARHDRA
jgi:hypothetical protein